MKKIRTALAAITLVCLSFTLACTRPNAPTATMRLLEPTALPARLILPTAAATPLPTPSWPPSIAPLPTVTGDPARQELIDLLELTLDEEFSAGYFSGTVLIAYQGDILVNKGYGQANRKDDSANTPQTEFRIASLTKQFTAMAILILQEQGRLDVQDPICRYLPSCPEEWKEVTLHHLLTHTSGIPDNLAMLDAHELAQPWTRDELIAYFQDLPLGFPPGEQSSYSNSGYVLLGYVIEQVSGEPYARFLQENIFIPLQMMSTGYDDQTATHRLYAVGYTPDGAGASYPADIVDGSVLYAAGGLYSTVEDLYRWDQALYTDRLVSQETMESIFTPYTPPPNWGGEGGYGYGWIIDKHMERTVVFHTGYVSGFASVIMRWPEDRLTIIILSNLEYAPVADIGYLLAQMVQAP